MERSSRTLCHDLEEIIHQISLKNVKKLDDHFELLETVASVNSLDCEIFEKKERHLWQTQLLIKDIQAHFSDQDLQVFATNWLQVEEKLGLHNSNKILSWIQRKNFSSAHELLELAEIILDFNFFKLKTYLLYSIRSLSKK